MVEIEIEDRSKEVTAEESIKLSASERARKSWDKRRERYGPSGIPEASLKRIKAIRSTNDKIKEIENEVSNM